MSKSIGVTLNIILDSRITVITNHTFFWDTLYYKEGNSYNNKSMNSAKTSPIERVWLAVFTSFDQVGMMDGSWITLSWTLNIRSYHDEL